VADFNESNLLRGLLKARDAEREPWDAIIFNNPAWHGLVRELPARARIFDAMDDLSEHAFSPAEAEQEEISSLEIADRVWTGTSIMAERLSGRHRHIRFIPNGVDAERFIHPDQALLEACRDEVASVYGRAPGGSALLAGYFGMLNERIDPRLLQPLLDAGWRVLLIGPTTTTKPALPDHPGLRLLGPKPYASLPAYLALMDLALIPYRTDGANRYLYPVKALEYLAGRKPVLSTPLPDVVKLLGEYVLCESEAEGWGRVARDWDRIKPQAAARAQAGAAYARSRGWQAMIDEMVEELASVMVG
jgi:glycosyltransferase involved in cell wall biosynthesis